MLQKAWLAYINTTYVVGLVFCGIGFLCFAAFTVTELFDINGVFAQDATRNEALDGVGGMIGVLLLVALTSVLRWAFIKSATGSR